jgi:hypothetical protein
VPVGEIIIYSENHTQHLNMLCGQSKEFHHFKAGSKNSNHSALNGDYLLLTEHFFTNHQRRPIVLNKTFVVATVNVTGTTNY